MPSYRPPCTVCGYPTSSVTRLCNEHRPIKAARRPERPCTGCGKKTMAERGVCRKCLKPERTIELATPCTECGIELTHDGVCFGCTDAIRDDREDRPGESHYDLDDLGIWRFDPVRRVQVFAMSEEAA